MQPYLVFTQPPTSVDSAATADTLVFDQRQVTSNAARFASVGMFTSAAAPGSASGAAQLLAAGARPFVDINNPIDGALFYIGPAGVTPATGFPVYPGCRIQITGYTGAVWTVADSPLGPATLFYRTS